MAATVLDHPAAEVTKDYTFFNPKLIDVSYRTGDVYSKEKVAVAQAEWQINDNDMPYLRHVKSLSATWPHLRLLADFMEIGTTPMRWTDFRDKIRTEDERNERASRTNVTRLDYLDSGRVNSKCCTTSADLKDALDQKSADENDDKARLRLFVVEDLSRDVVELLGAHLNIEPAFFREHILDYAWYNIRDRWIDPPKLNVVARQQHWFQLRFVTARYFKTAAMFRQGCEEAELFNVLRRPDDDQNNKATWDEDGAIVALSRTRASFWLRHDEGQDNTAVGVLLLDPTIRQGTPLWNGYRNWEPTPDVGFEGSSSGPPRNSLYKDFVYWAQKPEIFVTPPPKDPDSGTHLPLQAHMPIQALLHIVCAEWLTIAEYIKTRLGQIEWEISFPEHFLHKGSDIDVALKKLHTWRRLVPLYREMLTETQQRVFRSPSHVTNSMNGTIGSSTTGLIGAYNNTGIARHDYCQCALYQSTSLQFDLVRVFRDDFARALALMEEYQKRIDRLTSVVTAIITIEDARRGLDENRNLARLTWLATFFIPLSFVASLFSMQVDLSGMAETLQLYFAIALPLSALSLGLAVVLTLPSVQRLGRRTRSAVLASLEKKNV